MSIQPPPPDPAYARQTAQRERFLVLLNELVDIDMELARGIRVQARSEPAADLTIPLERINRMTRRTMALADKYAEPIQPKGQRTPAERQLAHERITRDGEDAIQRRAETSKEARELRNELRERIDSPDMAFEIDHRPVKLIITDLLRDLGLAHIEGTHPWARRTPKDIALLKARAAAASTGPP